MIAPCKDCERKGCGAYHDICPEYKEYKKFVEEERKKNLANQTLRCDLNYVHFARFKRFWKDKRK